MYGESSEGREVDISSQKRVVGTRIEQQRNPYTGQIEDVEVPVVAETPVIDIVKKIVSTDFDPDAGDEKTKRENEKKFARAKERFGYDEGIKDSAKFIEEGDKSRGVAAPASVTPEVLARFRKIVEHAQFSVNFFTDDKMAEALNAMRGIKNGSDGALSTDELEGYGVREGFRDYLLSLAKVVDKIQAEVHQNPPHKFSLGEIKNYIAEMEAIKYMETQEDGTKVEKQDKGLEKLTHIGKSAREYLIRTGFKGLERPECFEDIIGLIMISDRGEYRVGGKKEVMDREGNIKIHNFLKWLQDQLWYFSDFQDDDEFSGYQYVAFYTTYRQISLTELIITEPKKYFRKRTKTGDVEHVYNQRTQQAEDVPLYRYERDGKYDNLRDYLVVLVTNSGVHHNNSIKFDKSKELRTKEWHQMMREMYGVEQSSFGNRFLRWFGLMATNEEEVNAYLDPKTNRDQHQIGGTLGQAMSRALLIHWNLQELGHRSLLDPSNNFMKALGRENYKDDEGIERVGGKRAFFQSLIFNSLKDNKYLRDAITISEGGDEAMKKAVDAYQGLIASCKDSRFTERDVARSDVFTILSDKKNRDAFMGIVKELGVEVSDLKKIESVLDKEKEGLQGEVKLALAMVQVLKGYKKSQLNFYEAPAKIRTKVGERQLVQDAIRDAIMAEHNIPQEDAIYGAHYVNLMGGWFGIQAKNDVSLNSLNWWTTVHNFFAYRHEKEEVINMGDPETLNGIKQFLLPLEALPVKIESYYYKDPKTGKEVVVHDPRDPEYMAVRAQHGDKVALHKRADYNISLLEYLQGGKGANFDIGGYQRRRARGTLADNAMKKYHAEHLAGMIGVHEAFYQHRGLDLANVIKHQPGTGEPTIDSEKEEKFQKFRSQARNAFSKAVQTWGLEWDPKTKTWKDTIEQSRIIVRERKVAEGNYELKGKDGKVTKIKKGDFAKEIDSDTGEIVDSYQFVDKRLHEAVFHENIRDMNVNHSEHAQKLAYGEQAVRQLIGWGTNISFWLHRWRLWKGYKATFEDPLYESWQRPEVELVRAFFMHNPSLTSETIVKYGSPVRLRRASKKGIGRLIPVPEFGRKSQKIFRLEEGIFSASDLQDITKRSGTTNLRFLWGDTGGSTLIAIIAAIFDILKSAGKSNSKLEV